MSDADRDAMVLEAIGGDAEDLQPTTAAGGEEMLAVPRKEWEQVVALAKEVPDLRRRVQRLEAGHDGDPTPPMSDAMTTLQGYTAMVQEGHGDPLGVTDRRAVAINRHWRDLKERLANGQYGVSTRRNSNKKNQPSQLKVDLQNILDEDLEWEQIYRAMKAVAELSGGELEQDQYGRQAIVGGDYEYHERTTPDNNSTYKVLVEP